MIDNSTYISIDIEATGPIPGPFSMISLGAAAYDDTGKLLDTFEINFEELPNSARDPDTMQFWARNKEAWEYAMKNPVDPQVATQRFVDWLKGFNKPTAICYPAGFDFTFVYWYIVNFCGLKNNPLSFSCLDIKSYIAGYLNKPFRSVYKGGMPEHWFSGRQHSHRGLDDALEQGDMFFNILKERNNKKNEETRPQTII